MGITHTFVSTNDQSPDSTRVSKNEWNAAHVVELAYAEFTGTVGPTATTAATANTVVTAGAVTFDGSTVVMVEFFAPYASPANTAGAYMIAVLYDGSSNIDNLGMVRTPSATADHVVPFYAFKRLTPTAASHTYSIRAYVSTGTGDFSGGAGGAGNYCPGFIRITKV